MDVFTIAVTAAVTSLVSGLVGAVVATLIGMAKDKRRNDTASDQALREGMKLLLVDKVTYLTQAAVSEGQITLQQRSFIHELAKCARALGANGETEECDKAADTLPLIHV